MTITNDGVDNEFITPILNDPTIVGSILDENGVPLLALNPIASAVNYLAISNAIDGTGGPTYTAIGTSTSINITLASKGLGGVYTRSQSGGFTTPAGYKGELVSQEVVAASPAAFTNAIAGNLTSITVQPGEWDIFGNILAQGTTVTALNAGVNTVSATLPVTSRLTYIASTSLSSACGGMVPALSVNITVPTTYYLVANITGTGTLTGVGRLWARRI